MVRSSPTTAAGSAACPIISGSPRLLIFLLLAPAVLWLGIVYLGSLLALLLQSFFSLDDFSGVIVHEFTLKTYGELLRPQNFDIIVHCFDGGHRHRRLGYCGLPPSPMSRRVTPGANGRR